MDYFFNPKTVAVVGASSNGVGRNLLQNVRRSLPEGRVFPVNAKHPSVDDLRAWPTVDAIEEPVELAVALVPAKFMPGVVESCARKGVRGVIIEGAGFAETGDEGRALQKRCVDIARESGMRLWGPNCMGMVDVTNRRFFSFMFMTDLIDLGVPGNVSMVVQSGMLSAGFLVDLTQRRFQSVSKVCSVGNMCDVDESDILEYLLADPDTKAVGLYLESIGQARRFLNLVSNAQKPVVVLKAGRSQAGARAALSHTASLAGNARLTDSLLREAGALLANDFNQMYEIANTAAMVPQAKPGASMAVVTFSGGAGILSCDLLEGNGLPLARLSEQSLEVMRGVYPEWMAPDNPMDLYPAMERSGDLKAIQTAMDVALADPAVDGILLHQFSMYHQMGLDYQDLGRRAREAGKFLAVWCFGTPDDFKIMRRKLAEAGIPMFDEISRMAACVSEAARFQPGRGEIAAPLAEAQAAAAQRSLDEVESKALLAKVGVPVVADHLADDARGAASLAAEIGYPVVLKGILPEVVHKTELGLVRPNIADEATLLAEAEDMLARMEGKGRLLVQQRVDAEYELIAGMVRDQRFGPCVMLGLGGQMAELRPDITFGIAPLSHERALAMIDRLESRELFDGWRGMPPLDRRALAELLVALGGLAWEDPSISQIDINPVLIAGGGPLAVDASVITA